MLPRPRDEAAGGVGLATLKPLLNVGRHFVFSGAGVCAAKPLRNNTNTKLVEVARDLKIGLLSRLHDHILPLNRTILRPSDVGSTATMLAGSATTIHPASGGHKSDMAMAIPNRLVRLVLRFGNGGN
jgi:hypothetical protein